jgi:PIN domain nuclease of toxin-antitoxin system
VWSEAISSSVTERRGAVDETPSTAAPVGSLVWRPADQPAFEGMLLLDTHIWVWMLNGSLDRCAPTLPPLLIRGAQRGQLVVSEFSFWEIAQKEAAGKLVLTMPVEAWIERAMGVPGIRYQPVDRITLVSSTRLAALPGDPADRILVAAAKLHGAAFATIDRAIIGFAKKEGATAVCDARR